MQSVVLANLSHKFVQFLLKEAKKTIEEVKRLMVVRRAIKLYDEIYGEGAHLLIIEMWEGLTLDLEIYMLDFLLEALSDGYKEPGRAPKVVAYSRDVLLEMLKARRLSKRKKKKKKKAHKFKKKKMLIQKKDRVVSNEALSPARISASIDAMLGTSTGVPGVGGGGAGDGRGGGVGRGLGRGGGRLGNTGVGTGAGKTVAGPSNIISNAVTTNIAGAFDVSAIGSQSTIPQHTSHSYTNATNQVAGMPQGGPVADSLSAPATEPSAAFSENAGTASDMSAQMDAAGATSEAAATGEVQALPADVGPVAMDVVGSTTTGPTTDSSTVGTYGDASPGLDVAGGNQAIATGEHASAILTSFGVAYGLGGIGEAMMGGAAGGAEGGDGGAYISAGGEAGGIAGAAAGGGEAAGAAGGEAPATTSGATGGAGAAEAGGTASAGVSSGGIADGAGSTGTGVAGGDSSGGGAASASSSGGEAASAGGGAASAGSSGGAASAGGGAASAGGGAASGGSAGGGTGGSSGGDSGGGSSSGSSGSGGGGGGSSGGGGGGAG